MVNESENSIVDPVLQFTASRIRIHIFGTKLNGVFYVKKLKKKIKRRHIYNSILIKKEKHF